MFFEDDELVVGILHYDGSFEAGVREGFDDLALLRGGVFALESVDLEAEGGLSVLRPEMFGSVAHALVERWVGGS